MTKNKTLVALAVVLVALVGYGIAQLTTEPKTQASPSGTTFNTAKVAAKIFNPTVGTATSTSIYNSDSNDRIVTDAFGYCSGTGTSKTAYTGGGLASLIFTAATTSTNAPTALGNTNYTLYNIVSTSTADSYFASTTMAVGTFGRVWASGTYMTFASNATNTANCVVGVHYLAN